MSFFSSLKSVVFSDTPERAQRAAEVAYWKMVGASVERQGQAMSTYAGAVETRVDEHWQRGGPAIGPGGTNQPSESLKSLRDRSRNLERNNLLACGVLDRFVENVVGTTFRIEPQSSSKEFNAAVRRWWKRWAHTTACDARGKYTFGAILRLVLRAKMRDGDVGIVLTMSGDPGFERPRLQVISGERICSPKLNQYKLPAGNQLVEGVEMDAYGRPVAYWIDVGGGRTYSTAPVRVDARDFIFLSRSNHYGDVRGEPAFAGGFGLFGQIMGYLEASVIAARVGASSAMFVKKRDPRAAINGLGTQPVFSDKAQKSSTEKWQDVQPGQIHYLELDEEIGTFNPSQPTQQLPDAIATFARFVGVKFGLTVERVLLDFSRTTFSGGKQASNQERETSQIEQEDLATSLVSRVYQWAVSKAVQLDEIGVPAPDDYWEHEWIPPARPSPQPDKDIQVAKEAIALGVDARSYVAMSLGYYFPELCAQNKKDRDEMLANGLPLNDDLPGAAVADGGGDPTTDANTGEPLNDTGDLEAARLLADATGIATRAGIFTPTIVDEERFRQVAGAPAMTPDARKQWAANPTREPITIRDDATANAPAAKPIEEEKTPDSASED